MADSMAGARPSSTVLGLHTKRSSIQQTIYNILPRFTIAFVILITAGITLPIMRVTQLELKLEGDVVGHRQHESWVHFLQLLFHGFITAPSGLVILVGAWQCAFPQWITQGTILKTQVFCLPIILLTEGMVWLGAEFVANAFLSILLQASALAINLLLVYALIPYKLFGIVAQADGGRDKTLTPQQSWTDPNSMLTVAGALCVFGFYLASVISRIAGLADEKTAMAWTGPAGLILLVAALLANGSTQVSRSWSYLYLYIVIAFAVYIIPSATFVMIERWKDHSSLSFLVLLFYTFIMQVVYVVFQRVATQCTTIADYPMLMFLFQLFDDVFSDLVFLVITPYGWEYWLFLLISVTRGVFRDSGYQVEVLSRWFKKFVNLVTSCGRGDTTVGFLPLLPKPEDVVAKYNAQKRIVSQNWFCELISSALAPLLLIYDHMLDHTDGVGKCILACSYSHKKTIKAATSYIVVLAFHVVSHVIVVYIMKHRKRKIELSFLEQRLGEKLKEETATETSFTNLDEKAFNPRRYRETGAYQPPDPDTTQLGTNAPKVDLQHPKPTAAAASTQHTPLTQQDEEEFFVHIRQHWRGNMLYFIAVGVYVVAVSIRGVALRDSSPFDEEG